VKALKTFTSDLEQNYVLTHPLSSVSGTGRKLKIDKWFPLQDQLKVYSESSHGSGRLEAKLQLRTGVVISSWLLTAECGAAGGITGKVKPKKSEKKHNTNM